MNYLCLTPFPQRVYLLNRIQAQQLGKVRQVWIWEDKEYHRVEIDIKLTAGSIYSEITLKRRHKGNWRVEVRHGNVTLARVSFKAVEASP
jgi:hypothetical protein